MKKKIFFLLIILCFIILPATAAELVILKENGTHYLVCQGDVESIGGYQVVLNYSPMISLEDVIPVEPYYVEKNIDDTNKSTKIAGVTIDKAYKPKLAELKLSGDGDIHIYVVKIIDSNGNSIPVSNTVIQSKINYEPESLPPYQPESTYIWSMTEQSSSVQPDQVTGYSQYPMEEPLTYEPDQNSLVLPQNLSPEQEEINSMMNESTVHSNESNILSSQTKSEEKSDDPLDSKVKSTPINSVYVLIFIGVGFLWYMKCKGNR